jgi:putative MATE family efflux protein
VTSAAPPSAQARFVQGSTLRHVLVMTGAGAIGLMSIFIVDFLNLFYISLLKDPRSTAAVGYASTVLFFMVSVCIGLMIGVAAVVSKALGAGERDKAIRYSSAGMGVMLVVVGGITLISLPFLRDILASMGAVGETGDMALRFLYISMPSNLLLGIGMAASAVLRGVGDAKRSMYVTLIAGISTAIIDPILIFGLDMGIDGAAVAVNIARIGMAGIGLWAAGRIHGLLRVPSMEDWRWGASPILKVALPAVLTNIASPVANGYMNAALSPFGDQVIAANAVIMRLVPLAFGVSFALSAAVGPILGQNWGAKRYDRIKRAFGQACGLTLVYCSLVWIALIAGQDLIVSVFHAQDETAAMIRYFCVWIAWSWLFHSMMFVANAAFNNLGFPLLSTGFNWGKATIGTIPFAIIGAQMAGAEGALMGQALGAVVFGVASLIVVFWVLHRLEKNDSEARDRASEKMQGTSSCDSTAA